MAAYTLQSAAHAGLGTIVATQPAVGSNTTAPGAGHRAGGEERLGSRSRSRSLSPR
jgi:hypothetical protein